MGPRALAHDPLTLKLCFVNPTFKLVNLVCILYMPNEICLNRGSCMQETIFRVPMLYISDF